MRYIPTMPAHEFHSPEEMLRFLRSDAGADTEPLLILHRGHLTVTYVGGEPARAESIGRALARLSDADG